MGRATHNKATANNMKPGSTINIQTSTKVLNSLQDLSTVVLQQPKVISHGKTLCEDQTISNIYDAMSAFASLSHQIVKWYDENETVIKNQDQLAIDMLHEIELSSPKDLWGAYKCYKKLRESRQIRRKAKCENKMLSPLYGYIKSHPTLPKDMTVLCERCAGIQYDLSHAQYSFKSNLEI